MDTLTIIIGGGIILVAITIAIVLANRNWNRKLKTFPAEEKEDPIEHYTEMRDELTLEDAGVEDDEEEDDEPTISVGGGFSFTRLLSALIGGVVMIMVGNIVISQVKAALPPEELNTMVGGVSMGTILNIMPVMIIIPAVLMILFTLIRPGESEEPVKEDRIKKAMRKKGVKHYTRMRDKLSTK